MMTVDEIVAQEVKFYKTWNWVYIVLLTLHVFFTGYIMTENDQLRRKLNSPEYENCRLALIQCNNMNALIGHPHDKP